MGLVRLKSRAALCAGILVVAGIGVAQTDLGLNIPVTAQYPRITVRHTATDESSLVTGVLQLAHVASR